MTDHAVTPAVAAAVRECAIDDFRAKYGMHHMDDAWVMGTDGFRERQLVLLRWIMQWREEKSMRKWSEILRCVADALDKDYDAHLMWANKSLQEAVAQFDGEIAAAKKIVSGKAPATEPEM